MKLSTETMITNRITCHGSMQITLEDDKNVPDTKPDMDDMITRRAYLELTETVCETDRCILRGQLHFSLLYTSSDDIRPVHSMEGQIPFEETMHLDGISPADGIFCQYDLEDCQIQLIHSRKISVRAIASFHCQAEAEVRQPVGVDILSGEAARAGMENLVPDGLHKRFRTISYTQASPRQRDVFRIKDALSLPKGKPEIDTILSYDMTPQNLQTRPSDDGIRITGDLHLFVLYTPIDAERSMEYLETELTIDGILQCPGCREQMIPDISFQPQNSILEVRPDEDGEQRILELELPLSLTIKFYEDMSLSLLDDAYSTACELSLTRTPISYEHLLLKTQNVLRVAEQIRLDDTKAAPLQICTASGKVQIDEQEILEDGITLEGVVSLDILTITEDDSHPLASIRSVLPFQHFIEVRGISPEDPYLLQTDISQINVILLDASELEAKVVISVSALVFSPAQENIVTAIEEAPQNLERLQQMPGIVGFIAGDHSSLWEIAREYQTSPESIMELNGLSTDQIQRGDRLLLAKQVDGL